MVCGKDRELRLVIGIAIMLKPLILTSGKVASEDFVV